MKEAEQAHARWLSVSLAPAHGLGKRTFRGRSIQCLKLAIGGEMRHWLVNSLCFVVLALGGLVAACDDGESESTELFETDSAAISASALNLEELDTLSALVSLLGEELLSDVLAGPSATSAFSSRGFSCDDGSLPEDSDWAGYCWTEFSEKRFGLVVPGSYSAATYSGRVGYKAVEELGVVRVKVVSIEDTEVNPQELSVELDLAWQLAATEEEASRYVVVSSPPGVYSTLSDPEPARLRAFCEWYLEHGDALEEIVNDQGSGEHAQAVASFDEFCQLLAKIPAKESSVTTYLSIKEIRIENGELRGSVLLGKAETGSDFGEGANMMALHWGYPATEESVQSSSRRRILVKFKGDYKGIPFVAPAAQEGVAQCYLVDLDQADLQASLELANQVAAGNASIAELIAGVSLPVEKCPWAASQMLSAMRVSSAIPAVINVFRAVGMTMIAPPPSLAAA